MAPDFTRPPSCHIGATLANGHERVKAMKGGRPIPFCQVNYTTRRPDACEAGLILGDKSITPTKVGSHVRL